MNKDEILEISRKSKKDEGIKYAENLGRKIGFIIFVLLFIFLAIFNLFLAKEVHFMQYHPYFGHFLLLKDMRNYNF